MDYVYRCGNCFTIVINEKEMNLMLNKGLKLASSLGQDKQGLFGKVGAFTGKLQGILGSNEESLDATSLEDSNANLEKSLFGKKEKEELAMYQAEADAKKKKNTMYITLAAVVLLIWFVKKKK